MTIIALPIDPLLNSKEVARILGIHPNTLWKWWRNKGYGPMPVEIGPQDDRIYRSRRREMERFIEQSSRENRYRTRGGPEKAYGDGD